MIDNLINIGLIVAYFALIVAVGALVLFPVVTIIKGDFMNARGTLIGIAGLAAIFILAYILSPADQGAFYTKMDTSPGLSKIIGAGLLSTYIIMAVFLIITLYTAIAKWFK
jgi:hypothetical protein